MWNLIDERKKGRKKNKKGKSVLPRQGSHQPVRIKTNPQNKKQKSKAKTAPARLYKLALLGLAGAVFALR